MTFFAAAFARCQLRKLDKLNGLRRRNSEYLTKHLGEIAGISPPYVPPDRTHVYFFYVMRIKFDELGLKIQDQRDELGLNANAAMFRTAIERALNAEGVPIGQWQTVPVPSQSVFQFKDGYGLGCPWSCPFYTNRIEPFHTPVQYRNEDYPETLKLIDEYLMISRITPPNDLKLMELYVNQEPEPRQKSTPGQMIFKIPELVAFWSQMTQEPGDIITSGTPGGVAASRQPDPGPWFLKPGDIVEARIEGLGVLRNPIV
jgi:hypothetical protein